MNLIEVAPNIMINPEYVSSIRFETINGEKCVVCVVEGVSYVVKKENHARFFSGLKTSGVRETNQFFAG